MKRIAVFVLAVLIPATGTAEPLKIPAVTLIAGQTFDLVSTLNAFDRGCTEGNDRVFGRRPSTGTLVAAKAAATVGVGVAMLAAAKTDHPKVAKFLGYFGGGLGAGAGMMNVLNSCKGGR